MHGGAHQAGTLIVGTGQTGLQVAVSLREAGYAAPVTLIGEEPVPPYQRPPLSKAFLLGKIGEEALSLRSGAFLAAQDIGFLPDRRVVAIDRPERCIRTADGATLPYDHLVLATGARNRTLQIPGAQLGAPGAQLGAVLSLRSLHDAKRLRAAMDGKRRAVVIGAGFIGLEFAAVASTLGLAVTVVEAGPRLMSRAVSSAMAAHMQARHEARGVVFELGTTVAAIQGSGHAESVQLADGRVLPADLVLVAVGVVPNTELAQQAGLDVADGIVVDAQLRTADPAISAAGDCASGPNPHAPTSHSPGLLRLESVQNAIDQAKTIAARLAGHPEVLPGVPWFWSDQGPDKLQIAGLLIFCQEHRRLGDDPTRFSILSFRDGILACVESINRPTDHMAARRLLQAGRRITLDDAARPGFQLAPQPQPAPAIHH